MIRVQQNVSICGDYSVVEAPDSVKVVVRDRYPLVTPQYAGLAQG